MGFVGVVEPHRSTEHVGDGGVALTGAVGVEREEDLVARDRVRLAGPSSSSLDACTRLPTPGRCEQRDLSIAAARLALSSRDLASGPGRLAALATVLEEAERALRMEVSLARSLDVSWTEIGASLGVIRQAAQQRFSLALAS